jgi:glutamate-1-semialdehyde aminotransferase
VAVHEYCYHGSVDETIAVLDGEPSDPFERRQTVARRGNLGPAIDPALTTRVVPYNDLDALDHALQDRRVAALLIEPALTNVGIVLPEPGYLEGVREITRRHGTILIHDETHTICAGPGGMTGAGGYDPDMLVIGKTIGGGIPVAAYGMTSEVADRTRAAVPWEDADVGGIGGTLAGYALSMAAARAALGEVLTAEAFERMIPLAARWEIGVNTAIDRHGAPWSVTRLGARAEYHFMPEPPRDGADQIAHADAELERLLHLWVMNRGVLMTPFHNMALMSPVTSTADVDRHTEAFDAALEALFG